MFVYGCARLVAKAGRSMFERVKGSLVNRRYDWRDC